MKQQASVQGVRCPVNCPVCHYNGTGFPARFRRISLPASGMVDRITNKSNHVLFLLEGAVHVCQGRDNIYLQAGQCMFFSRDVLPEIKATKPSDIVWRDFTNRIVLGGHDVLSKVASESAQENDQAFPILEMNDAMRRTLTSMQPVDSPCWHLLWQYELYLYMVNGYTHEELSHFFRPILRANDDFRAFVTNNYTAGDTVDDIARKANLSKSYFFQRFKDAFGISAHQWLIKQKEQKLLQTVASGLTDSKTLVDKFGFKNQAGLYLFCRRHFGCSFSELKQRNWKTNTEISLNQRKS